jgi:hypothetical protein
MLVDFMVIGAAKCGTTSLAYELSQHPKINFSKIKEPHFFSQVKDWRKNIQEYHNLFDEEEGKIYGEASPYYTLHPEFIDTSKRIFEYNPKIKLIYIIRNPIERIYSNYKFQHAFNLLKYPLKDMEKEILENPIYINRSKYFMQIEQYLKYFPKEQLLICHLEEYIENNTKVLNNIHTFLGIDNLISEKNSKNVVHLNDTSKIANLTKFGNYVARLPFIYDLPRPLKHLFRPFFTVKMNHFIEMSPLFQEKLWAILHEDISKMSHFSEKNLVETWGKKKR